jgi:hypothetical protein
LFFENLHGPGIDDGYPSQEALRASDRALLAFYGRGHPAAITHFPAHQYEARYYLHNDVHEEGWSMAAQGTF